MQSRDLFVEVFGQHIDLADLVFLGLGEKFDLRDGLVGKARRHHEAGVTGAATQIHQTALGQQDDALGRRLALGREDHVIDLRLDLFPLALVKRSDVDLVVKVADVANDSLVFHGRHVLVGDDVLVAGAGHEDVALVGGVFHGHDLVAFHRRLQGVDRVDLGHPDLGRESAQCLGRTLADIAVAGNAGDLAGDHHVGGALDGVHQRFAAAVQVVELALGHRVVDVDGAQLQAALDRHLVEAVHAGGGFFGHADDVLQAPAVPGRVDLELGLDRVEEANLFFAAGLGQQLDVGLGAGAEVHQQRGVAAVVQNHVRAFGLGTFGAKFKDAVRVVPIVNQGLALVGKHRRAGFDQRGSGVVLRREDVARSPAHFGAKRLQGLDQHAGLNRHVQRAGDARALERLRLGEFLADRHQARHFGLGDVQFLAAPGGQAQVGNHVILVLDSFRCGAHGLLQS